MICSERGLGGFFGLEDLRDALTKEEDVIEPDPEEVITTTDESEDEMVETVTEEEALKVAEPETAPAYLEDEEDVTDHIHDAGVLAFGEEPVYLNGGVKNEEEEPDA